MLSFTAFTTVAALCQSSLQAKRDRFACYEMAISRPYEEKRRRGWGSDSANLNLHAAQQLLTCSEVKESFRVATLATAE